VEWIQPAQDMTVAGSSEHPNGTSQFHKSCRATIIFSRKILSTPHLQRAAWHHHTSVNTVQLVHRTHKNV